MTSLTQLALALRRLHPAGGCGFSSQARRRVVVWWCAAAACALLATACGTAVAGSGGRIPSADPSGSGGAAASTGPAAPQVSLDVTIYPANNAGAEAFTLSCEPPSGTVPDPAAACAQLLANPGLFFPAPGPVMMCPMIMASSARAFIDGTYLGRRVDESIDDGGCDLQRWAELMQIFSVSGSDLQPVNPGGPVLPATSAGSR